jgi:methionine-R-sulfoxide reductase
MKEFFKPSTDEIRKKLTKLQYEVTQNKGTERAFKNEYWNNNEIGIYVDIVTEQPLFSSKDKFKSGSGWPSFTKPISEDLLVEVEDKSLGMNRIEIKSALGDTHLGHLFYDGPKDVGGRRYCMNSASLKFIPKDKMIQLGYEDYIKFV